MGIAQVFDSFFEDAPTSGAPEIGRIYWVPTQQVYEVPLVLDVQRATPTEHEVTDFSFVELGAPHFRAGRRLPIKRLSLEDTEELLVSKAKKRPCIVLGRAGVPSEDVESLPSDGQKRLAKPVAKTIYLVAPMYSCSTHSELNTWGPVITARVRALWYPHLAWFPGFDGKPPGHIVRLDHLFPTHLGRGCEAATKAVHEEVLEVVQAQLIVTLDGQSSEWLEELKELVQSCLPDELKNK